MCEDGPNEKYYEASLRVIHLLKQPTKEKPSLPELIREIVKDNKLGRKFMYRVAQRSYGLLHNFAPWEEVANQNNQILGEALLQSGIVNVVNDQCAKVTPQANLGGWAKQYINRWHGQIRECKPRLVVCGGTFSAIQGAFLQQERPKIASTGMKWFNDPELNKCTYLDAPHPTARYPLAMVYTYLMVSASEILEKSS